MKRGDSVRIVSATLVAELGRHPGGLLKEQLRAELGAGLFVFGQALAEARLFGYIGVEESVVRLTDKGKAVLEPGRSGR